MSRWLVTALPAGVLLIALAVASAGGAVLLTRWVRHRFPSLTGDAHNDVTRFTYGFIGFVYAFFVGFVVSDLWGQVNAADTEARAEAAAVLQMVRDAQVFDPPDQARVRAALGTYTDAALAEWDDVGAGTGTLVAVDRAPADTALVGLRAVYDRVQVGTDGQRSALASSLSHLDDAGAARTVRVLTARDDTGPPWPLWAVLLTTSAMVLGTVVLYGVGRPAFHYPMVAIVGVIVAANLFLVVQLSHPYLGAVATSPDPLRLVGEVLDAPR